MRWIRDRIARLCDARVRELEQALADARADARLARRELRDLEIAYRGEVERHRADVEAYALEAAARMGGVGMCWGSVAES